MPFSRIEFVKWIVCRVAAAESSAFAESQRAWSALASVSGFRGQLGGWNREPESECAEACVLGLWETRSSYDRFMREVHDPITTASRQGSTYVSSSVRHLDVVLRVEGEASSLAKAASAGGVLRVADCRVHPERVDHFTAMQASVWNPGMREATGLRAGLFSRDTSTPAQFLVTTVWRDEAAHAQYVAKHLDQLRAASDARADLDTIDGRVVPLEVTWTVLPA